MNKDKQEKIKKWEDITIDKDTPLNVLYNEHINDTRMVVKQTHDKQ